MESKVVEGVHVDALPPLHAAAETGNVAECIALLNQGAGVNSVDKNGFTALHIAAVNGSAEVCTLLLDRGKAAAQFVNVVARAESLKMLGDMYFFGHGVMQDLVKARDYYIQVAEQTDALQVQVRGLLGLGFLYKKLAEQAEPSVFYKVWSWCKGAEVHRDAADEYWKKALLYFKRASKTDSVIVYATASYNAGELYYLGQGVEKNTRKARKYFVKASTRAPENPPVAHAVQELARKMLKEMGEVSEETKKEK